MLTEKQQAILDFINDTSQSTSTALGQEIGKLPDLSRDRAGPHFGDWRKGFLQKRFQSRTLSVSGFPARGIDRRTVAAGFSPRGKTSRTWCIFPSVGRHRFVPAEGQRGSMVGVHISTATTFWSARQSARDARSSSSWRQEYVSLLQDSSGVGQAENPRFNTLISNRTAALIQDYQLNGRRHAAHESLKCQGER
jgi:hypothetical protein